jgi:hypothetical protein
MPDTCELETTSNGNYNDYVRSLNYVVVAHERRHV